MKTWFRVAAIGFYLGASLASAPAQAPTATTLAVTFSGSQITAVDPDSVITLTATVTSGGTPVTPGQVNFCDASVSWCTDVHLLGMAQLTVSGTASFKFVPGIGVHQIKAVFVGTNADAASSSAGSNLTVIGTKLPWSVGTPYSYFVLTTDPNPQTDVIADFNGDGKPDLAVSIGNAAAPASSVDVFLGNGDGTFNAAPAVPSTNAAAGSLVAGDFDGDGKQDLAVTLPGANQIQILLGNGDGSFTLGQNIPDSGGPSAIVAGDFNGDGIADLAVANRNGESILVLLGKGDGTFTPATQSPTFTTSPAAVAVGDFNGDGKDDLAVVLEKPEDDSCSLTILRGNGDGTFTPVPQTVTLPSFSISIEAADFTGNGILDLAIGSVVNTSPGNGFVMVFKGNGDGTFTLIPEDFVYAYNYVAFGDVENIGEADLFTTAAGYEPVAYFVQQNNGFSSGATQGWAVGAIDPPFYAVGDFNGDGFADIATVLNSANSVVIWTSDIYGNSTEIATTTTLTAVPTNLTVGQTLTLTATVTAASGPIPSGTVFFLNGVNVLDAASLDSNGVATVTLQPAAGAYSIAASYIGSSTDAPSVSEPSIAVNVGSLVSTFTSLQASATTVGLGQTVTLSATVTAVDGGIPGGTVTFFIGAAPIGTGTLNALGVTSIQTSLLPPGANSITAVYPGQGAFAASTTPPLIVTVNANSTTTRLTVAQTTLTVGQTLTLTATVTASSGGIPTGTVTFLNEGASLGTVTLNANGMAALTLTPAAGSYSITANYGGSSTDASSASSPPIAVTVYEIATSTDLQASLTILSLGQTLTLTATVTAASGATPGGTVTFLNNGATLGTASLNANGMAALTLMPAAGGYSITASYGGSSIDGPSASSPPIDVTVSKIATLIALQATPTTLYLGQTLTLTAAVTAASGAIPTGTVTFLNNGTSLGTASLNTYGTAVLTLTPAIGNSSITARYSGSSTDASSVSSPPFQVSVIATSTATTLVANPVSLTVTQTLTLTATVTATSGTTPAGAVTFFNNGASLGTALLSANGAATFTLTPDVGAYVLSATYNGSATDASSTSNLVDVAVNPAATTTVLTPSPDPAILGETVTLSANVTSGMGAPSGTISFYDGQALLGEAPILNGAVSLSTSSLSLGNHSLTAAYSGTTDFVTSTSAAVNEVITTPNFNISIEPSSRSVYTGESASYTVTFTQAVGLNLAVALSCSQLPANTTCAFFPDGMTQSGPSALTIQTTAPKADSSARVIRAGAGAALACLLLFFVPRRRHRGPLLFVILAALLVSATALGGCSGPMTLTGGTPVGAQAITVTATMTDGSQQFTQNATATLNVESLF